MVSSPVISTIFKSAPSWTAACPGAPLPVSPAAYAETFGPRPRDPRGERGLNLRFEQRIQDQGRSVFDHLLEGMTVPAPATAHVGVTVKGGVSGPYPWRQPV